EILLCGPRMLLRGGKKTPPGAGGVRSAGEQKDLGASRRRCAAIVVRGVLTRRGCRTGAGAAIARALEGLSLGIDAAARALRGSALSGTSAAVAPFAADLGHVSTIAADRLATLPAGDARLIGSELVGRAFGVRRPSTLACNLTLFRRVHRRKTALARVCH